jgi:hypothetical protein
MATPTQAGGVSLANGSQGDGYPLGFDRAPSWALAVAVQDDFNADDRSDILWRNDNGSLAIWTMNGTAITSGNNIASSPDATWHVNGGGDYKWWRQRPTFSGARQCSASRVAYEGLKHSFSANIASSPEAIWHIQGHHLTSYDRRNPGATRSADVQYDLPCTAGGPRLPMKVSNRKSLTGQFASACA